MSRKFRRQSAQILTQLALAATPRLPTAWFDVVQRWLKVLGPRLPIVSRQVAENMRAAGVYTPAVFHAYFNRIAAHVISGAHALRHTPPTASAVEQLLAQRVATAVELDDSIGVVRAAVTTGRGAVLMAPHNIDFLLSVPRVARKVPTSVYMRYPKTPTQREVKQRWCRAHHLEQHWEPAPSAGGAGRLAALENILRRGRLVYLTPDLARQRDEGVPVRVFGRTVYLPPGAAVLAQRSGAPYFIQMAHPDGVSQRLHFAGPFSVAAPTGARNADRVAIQNSLQHFAEHLERFVRESPELWLFWGDKRWTRVFRNDSAYVAEASPPSHNAATQPAGAC